MASVCVFIKGIQHQVTYHRSVHMGKLTTLTYDIKIPSKATCLQWNVAISLLGPLLPSSPEHGGFRLEMSLSL